MKNLWLFLAATALIGFAVVGFIMFFGSRHQGLYRAYRKASYSSVGEKIYYEGIGSDGSPISFTRGPHWLGRMGEKGCVACHGVGGKGGFPLMMTSTMATDITYDSLISGKHHRQVEGDEEEIPYSDETIKKAIAQGLDPSGKKFSRIMPRWKMTEEDLNELLAYLKEL